MGRKESVGYTFPLLYYYTSIDGMLGCLWAGGVYTFPLLYYYTSIDVMLGCLWAGGVYTFPLLYYYILVLMVCWGVCGQAGFSAVSAVCLVDFLLGVPLSSSDKIKFLHSLN